MDVARTALQTRALFMCGLQDNRWAKPHFEMDALENFATILPTNAARLPWSVCGIEPARHDAPNCLHSRMRRGKLPFIPVGEFYTRHADALQLKLVGPALGFERKIREPTINRPGLALSGFFTYFAGKRIQVLETQNQAI